MNDPHVIRCACGALRGALAGRAWVNRVLCYCDDCQAFAEFVGRADEILDARGASDIVQTAPACVTFSEGREHLACTRLTAKGPLRWYAACCRTPVGNTPANPKLAFVGLLHNCLGDRATLDAAFGPPAMRAFTRFARGEPKPKARIPPGAVTRMLGRLAWARLSGAYRHNPFFDAAGRPVVAPVAPERRRVSPH